MSVCYRWGIQWCFFQLCLPCCLISDEPFYRNFCKSEVNSFQLESIWWRVIILRCVTQSGSSRTLFTTTSKCWHDFFAIFRIDSMDWSLFRRGWSVFWYFEFYLVAFLFLLQFFSRVFHFICCGFLSSYFEYLVTSSCSETCFVYFGHQHLVLLPSAIWFLMFCQFISVAVCGDQ